MSRDDSGARDRLKRMESLFYAALDRPASRRSEFLEIECRNDGDLIRDVERLLRRHDDSSNFMQDSIWGRGVSIPQPDAIGSQSDLNPGDRVGRYRLIRELGVGGMGTVWLAERDDGQYQQEVALKIIKRGMDTDDVLRRFRNERQVLAHLEHPNIAHLLDGGATNDGRPFLVMEYVDGTRIDDHCEKEGLTVVQRLRLFQKICAALHYAHENLVVHRDIKPGNILVTNDGEPKLLDFGISKVLLSTESAATMSMTAAHRNAFTPRYASPEQFLGERYTTVGDVYSLGVVLFELLTGRYPYGAKAITREALERAVLETEPARPSSIAKELGSDIDAIVLKSLSKEPAYRYPTVDALASDIERHLTGHAVLAHPPGRFYRLNKFVRRHYLSVSSGIGVALLVLSFAVVAAGLAYRLDRQRNAAERRFEETRELAHSLIFDLHDAVAPIRGTLPARELIVRTGLQYLDTLSQEAGGDESLQLECAIGYFRVAEILGSPSGPSLGQTSQAMETCRKGERIIEDLIANHNANADVLQGAAYGSRIMGDLSSASGDTASAIDRFEFAIELLDRALQREGEMVETLISLEKSHFNLATCHERADRYADAERHFDRVIAVIDRRIDAGGDIHDARVKRANTLAALGHLLAQRGAFDAAEEKLESAIEVLDGAVESHPHIGNPRRSLVVASMDLGRVWLAKQESDAARTIFEAAIDDCNRLIESDPTDVTAKRDLSVAHRLLAKMLEASGDLEASLRHFEKAIRIRRQIVELDPTVHLSKRDLAVALDGAGAVMRKLERLDEALEMHEAAMAVFAELYESEPGNPRNARSLAITFYYLAQLYEETGRQMPRDQSDRAACFQKARERYRQSLEIMSDLRNRNLLRDDEAGIIDMLTREIQSYDLKIGAAN